jgi:hypothetical protein
VLGAREARGPTRAHDLIRCRLHAERRLRHADRSTHEITDARALLAVSALPPGRVAHGVILVMMISSGTPRAIAASRVIELHPPGVVQVHAVESVTVESE